MYNPSKVTIPVPFVKQPGENIAYSIDLSPALGSGESPTGTPTKEVEVLSSDVASPDTLTVSDISLSGVNLQFRASGGANNTDYLIRFTYATTDTTAVRQTNCIFQIRDK